MFFSKITNFFRPWWEVVDRDEVSEQYGIKITGDPTAWPKWILILWRFQHKWCIFEVENNDESYWVYFVDRKTSMMYRKEIIGKYFAARIPKQDIRFVAVNTFNLECSFKIRVVETCLSYLEVHDHKSDFPGLELI
ncbi:MAG: hypothetical protein H6779_05210 [Candidatus Nomurabacteria bacterium]|nr:MAG: hypothetical protein H6779_05210 [Candidatus Nomurabacteria bacterium]